MCVFLFSSGYGVVVNKKFTELQCTPYMSWSLFSICERDSLVSSA